MMGPGDFGSDPWDEFLARYFGRSEGGRRPAHRVDITRLMTADAREMLADAARRAAQKHSNDLDTDHLLWAALQREPLRDLVRRAGADPDALVNALGGRGDGAPRGEVPPNLSLTPAAKRALLDAHQLSRAMGANYIGPEHILMALPLNPESPAGRMLAAGRIQPESLQAASAERGPSGGPKPDRGTPTLDQYGQDLTELARPDQIDPVIGRADEIEQAVEILSRRTKNNPVLIGEAGVGKTAIVEGLAERICDGDVPQTLIGKRVVQLDLAGLVAGTRYRGDFEERLKKVIDEIRAHRDELIIFLDEIHTLVGAGGAGSEGGMDASNMLKPALARGELRVIGATTLDEYRKSIEKDAALARRFQPVLVPEPSVEDTVAILRGLRDRYEAHHQVRFTDEALVAAAELSDRYVTDRFLPDKAIDLIDQAGARVRLRTRTPAADVRELEQQLEEVRRDKEQAVADEQYERASAAARPALRTGGPGPPRPRRRGPQPGAVGRAEGDRRGGLPGHRHPGQPAHRGGTRPAAAAGGAPAREGGRPGRRGQRRRRGGPPLADRAGRPGPADGQLPLPRPDRCGQDRAGPRAGRGALRRGGPDGPGGHERVPGTAHGQPAGRRAARVRRLRGGRASSPRRCAAARTRWCCSTRSRRPTRTCSTSCCRCSTTAGSPTARAGR